MMARGVLWSITLGEVVRPAMIVAMPEGSELVTIVPAASHKTGLPWEVPIGNGTFARPDHIHAISRWRFKEFLGMAPATVLSDVRQYLMLLLGLAPWPLEGTE